MIVEHATAAVERGWHIFPLRPGTKTPPHNLTRWEQRASTDPVKLATAWEACPRANYGIATGPSGLVVIDCDMPKPGFTLPPEWQGPGIRDGRDVLAILCERAGAVLELPYTVVTPSGGWHLYYAAPEGTAIRNTARKIAPLVDVRASGGYVVGAGSVTGGTEYQALLDGDPVLPLPPWLEALLRPSPAPPPPLIRPPARGGLRSPRYAGRALEGELDKVLAAQPGERNVTLNDAALALGSLCATGELDTTEVAMLLCDAAAHIGLPPGEAKATIASGMRAGLAQPRSLL
jgi:hypothetical protein